MKLTDSQLYNYGIIGQELIKVIKRAEMFDKLVINDIKSHLMNNLNKNKRVD
jgi:uncharacterized tellurite resistance protein B-like protein